MVETVISSQHISLHHKTHLGQALLGFCAILILIMTWLPFRFEITATPRIAIGSDLSDAINNILLFIPLGFLYCITITRKAGQFLKAAFVAGFLFSLMIEIVQLFLAGRYTSPMDVLTNATGAMIGAWVYQHTEVLFNRHTALKMALHYPLSVAVYLMVPLLWLSSFTIGNSPIRLVFLLLIGCCGVIVFSAIYHHQWRWEKLVSTRQMYLMVALWFAGGTLPVMLKHPLTIASLILLLVFFTVIVIRIFALDRNPERRYEVPAVKRITILFTLYLFLLSYWPFQAPDTFWDMTWSLAEFADNPDLLPIFRLIEYVCAMTVFGYLIAEMAGRWIEGDRRRRRLWLYAFLVSFAVELEFVRGLHPEYPLSILRLLLAGIASLFGASIYRRQVGVIREVIARKKLGQ